MSIASALSNRDFLPSSWLKSLLLRKLRSNQRGRLVLRDPDGVFEVGRADSSVSAEISISDRRAYSAIVLGGSVGAAEAFILGQWDSPNLTNVIRYFVANRETLEGLDGPQAFVSQFTNRLVHLLRDNTLSGSRLNIAAHYDLGNEFFRHVLDPTLTYSCAYFKHSGDELEKASVNKLERMCQKLELKSSDSVLEIGTGWGSFALYAAKTYGCRVTTTTISENQYEYVRKLIMAEGLQDRVQLLKKDYRELEGQFDKVVSIEMIEAVGAPHLDRYLEVISRCLNPDGIAAIQAITIRDDLYERALRTVDFIKKHIFPGSFIPSLTAILGSASKTDLRLDASDDMTEHYAETLRRWSERLRVHSKEIHALGMGEEFQRMWRYYFAYCEGGFEERSIGSVQLKFTKPGYRRSLRGQE